MKQTFTTEKDAKKYATSLSEQADAQIEKLKAEILREAGFEEQSKAIKAQHPVIGKFKIQKLKAGILKKAGFEERSNAIKDSATLEGQRALDATKKYKKAALAEDEVNDVKIEQIIKEAEEKKVDELLPQLYFAINVSAKVANRGLSHAIRHPQDSKDALFALSDTMKRLKTELKVESLKGVNPNTILQTQFVTKLLRDPGLWQIIGLQSSKMPRILARFREDIGEEIRDIIETPSTINLKSKLFLTKEILDSTEALTALVQLAQSNQEYFANLLVTNTATKKLFADYGINASNINQLLPPILSVIEIVPKNREAILSMLKIVEPALLKRDKEAALKALAKETDPKALDEGMDLKALAKEVDLTALVPHLTALQEPLFKVIDSTLTPENVQLLANIPALKDYITPDNQKLIIDAGKRLMSCGESVQKFLTDRSVIIDKVLTGQANLAKGVFETTDLTANEMTAVAQTALQIMHKINPAELLKNNRDALINLMAPALPIVAKQDLSKLLIDAGTIFLSQDNLTTLEGLVTTNLPLLLDDVTPDKEKEERRLKIADFFVKQLQGPEFKALYRDGIVPFLNANKEKLGQMLSDLPALKKLNINGEQIITLLSDEKTIDTLQNAYTAFRTGSKVSAVAAVLPAFISSPELRAFVVVAIKEQIYSSAPFNFLKRLMVGSKVNAFINECIHGTPDGSRLNLAEKFNEQYGNSNGLFSHGLTNKDLKGLDFGALEFKSMDLDGFDFSQARFGSNKLTSFSGTSFKDAKFDNSVFRGEIIDLSNTTFDLASLRSIQPLLDKAIKEGKTIKAEGMKVNIDKLKDMQEIHKMKGSEFGKLYLEPDKDQQTEKIKYIIQGEEIPLTAKHVDKLASDTNRPPQERGLQ